MKVQFLKKCYNSKTRTTYNEGGVYDLSDEEASLMRGKDNDHFIELSADKPAEAPKRGRPAKEKPEE